jgi:hypothetical protein
VTGIQAEGGAWVSSSDRLREWWRFGTGWLWLARVLNVAGAVNFVLFIWMFLSFSLSWLLFFFMALIAFSIAARIKKRSVSMPVAADRPGRGDEVATSGGAKALGTAQPPVPMFDREGRTPLERVMRDGDDEK